jgi:RNA polymerase sigma factor (sigma-70 family)
MAYRLAWTCKRISARDVPADELVAEALLGLTYAAATFDEKRGVPFVAYLTMAVRHRLFHAVAKWRRMNRLKRPLPSYYQSRSYLDPEARQLVDPHAQTTAIDLCDRVRRILPPQWFEILRLYHSDGQTLAQIGHHYGVTRQRVNQILTQAADRVRRNFSELEF